MRPGEIYLAQFPFGEVPDGPTFNIVAKKLTAFLGL
jgi:hypothetical protein